MGQPDRPNLFWPILKYYMNNIVPYKSTHHVHFATFQLSCSILLFWYVHTFNNSNIFIKSRLSLTWNVHKVKIYACSSTQDMCREEENNQKLHIPFIFSLPKYPYKYSLRIIPISFLTFHIHLFSHYL